jgi:hypothetical protein
MAVLLSGDGYSVPWGVGNVKMKVTECSQNFAPFITPLPKKYAIMEKNRR